MRPVDFIASLIDHLDFGDIEQCIAIVQKKQQAYLEVVQASYAWWAGETQNYAKWEKDELLENCRYFRIAYPKGVTRSQLIVLNQGQREQQMKQYREEEERAQLVLAQLERIAKIICQTHQGKGKEGQAIVSSIMVITVSCPDCKEPCENDSGSQMIQQDEAATCTSCKKRFVVPQYVFVL